jgi:predicted ATPase/DNA-binding winged helix-turn-helix (wHTH) protein
MEQEHHLTFGPFRLDTTHGRLWRGERATTLRPRTLAMLRYLIEHRGRLVTKAELRQHVWAGAHVSDTVLRVCVQEIRAVLRDAAAAPRYLETVGRQGYRFLAGGDLEAPPRTAGPIVGREGEVAALERWFQQAVQGTRQLVLVSGEAGAGKTTVVDMWLARLGAGSTVRTVQGQCVEHYGAGEPYLPFLEALGQLSRGPCGQDVVAVLRRYAPLWLVELPGLLPEMELERLQRQVEGATSARMLRELADALDMLSAETPLVLVLEDLQWSDRATVEALAYLAQRRAPARLLLLGTYRPVEVVIQAHPLRGMVQELCGRMQAVELRLEFLRAVDVDAYVAGRLGGPAEDSLAVFVHERTEGNALFMVNIVEHLVQQRLVVRREGEWALRERAETIVASLPEGLRQFLVRRVEALRPEERRILETASLVGEEFAAAAVAAGAECRVEEVEALCEALAAQHHFIDDSGVMVWPDGTSGGSYRFQHALYQQVLSEQVGTARRGQLHRRIGSRLEAGYGPRAGEIAAQLAVHFERGGEVRRAAHYWQQAGENAARRNAYPEAIAALRKGLTLLATLPDGPERARRELALQLTLGELLMATNGMASPEAGEAYNRVHALCQWVGETPQLFRVLSGLSLFHSAQARLQIGAAFGQQLLDLALRQSDPALVREGHLLIGAIALYRGDLVASRAHLEHSLECSAAQQPSTPIFTAGLHPKTAGRIWLVRALWALGYADQARQRSQEVLALADQIRHSPSSAYARYFVTMLYQCRRDMGLTQTHAEALMAYASQQGFTVRLEQGRILRGWALAMQGDAAEGVSQIGQGLETLERAGGPQLGRPSIFSLLAEAYGQAGQPTAGLQALVEALKLATETGECWWEAELHRLKGALLLQLPIPEVPQAEACFHQALNVARRQQAKALELRAALSLSRLWQHQGKRAQARHLLEEVYDWFTEGFDTPDLQAAQALLETLG